MNYRFFIIYSDSISEVTNLAMEKENYFCILPKYYDVESFIKCFSYINFFVIPFDELLNCCDCFIRRRLKNLFCVRNRYLYAVVLVVSLDFN